MIRAAAYTRVSTVAQAIDKDKTNEDGDPEEKMSLTIQAQDIKAYCDGRGYTVVKEYQDIGSGASKRRPGFQQLLRDLQAGDIDVIVCWKSDRLSRGL